VNLSQFKPFK